MKAAVLNAFGSPLSIETVSDPVLGTGDVVVDVAAAGVANYTAGIFSGARNYLLELPVVPGPGGIGRVRATGPDATRLSVGDWVFCDPTVKSRDDVLSPDMILQGWTAGSEAGLSLHRYYHNGSFAEQMLVPTENVTPIGDIDPREAGRWSLLSRLLVPYGGLLAMDLQAGETVVINGATGGFGSAGVMVALAMGAGRVVATGRNRSTLDAMAARLGPRLRTARMSGQEAEDRQLILETAGSPVDAVLDFLPREARPSQVMAALLAVRPGGRVVLMGGVGRADGAGLDLPYSWMMRNNITVRGQYMYPRHAVPKLLGLVRSGLLDLGLVDVTEFGLSQANEAVLHAAENSGPHQMTVVRPDRS